tara:strand:+ start:53 stop:292 length:240 start_codon:yes stop_codon:yes gene_type:complete
MKKKLLPFILMLLFINCKDIDVIEPEKLCLDQNLVDELTVCYEIYAPVCGCDGNTYSNDCIADSNGILNYQEGECNKTN